MNTNQLKRFAKEARIKLLDQIGRKLDYVLTQDAALLRGKEKEISQLKQKVQQVGKTQVVETVAYTWFNRLMALRFMDANGYNLPRVVTPLPGMSNPEILQNALAGSVDTDLQIDRARLNTLLDGKAAVADGLSEAYKLLLVASCNHWHRAMPFMFERISDYSELLLPDDLLSDYGIVADIRQGMSDADCQQEELIGWLYQFYIADENERLISSKKAYTKNELAPASQLFTPKWIVRYMVDNTLGQMWIEMNPSTTILNQLEFYIDPSYTEEIQPRKSKRLEEIKFFDPCVGSAHILSYAFELFYLMYEEQGYSNSEIPELIIRNNLFGIDIDERAAQIAAFVLMMKGRRKNSRFLRKNIEPNITFYQDFEGDSKFQNAKTLGSLIKVEPNEIENVKIEVGSVFSDSQSKLKKLYFFLGQRYDCVVTNPPYISSSRMEATLKQYVETTYPNTKFDLFATFIIRCLELCDENGLTGYMTPFVWMFISSYESLRKAIIDHHFINNLIQLEYSGFDGATVPVCAFTLRNKLLPEAKGSYIRLTNFKGSASQEPKTLEAIRNQNCGWFYRTNQKDFEKIPGSPIGYWLNTFMIEAFEKAKRMDELTSPRSGLSTSDSPRFLRIWYETSCIKQNLDCNSLEEAKESKRKWFPMMKGGGYRKWYGNHIYLVNYEKDAEELKYWLVNNPSDPTTTSWSRYVRSPQFYFKRGLTWSGISSSKPSMRIMDHSIFGSGGKGLFGKQIEYVLGFLNSNICLEYLKVFSPTLNFEVGHINKLPLVISNEDDIAKIVSNCIALAKLDWDSKETSWGFEANELVKQQKGLVKLAIESYIEQWSLVFKDVHNNERNLNQKFIEIYGLTNKLNPEVPLEDITILQEEARIIDGQLHIDPVPVLLQLISYSIGCMFGRYSLDQPGLILANQGETLADYLQRVPQPSFTPDEDNIIPVLEGEWFGDDIVGRFRAFLRAAFGAEHFEENLKYIEDTLGKDIRRYLVKDFYNDHLKRYKKRPIYWMFSSPKGHFKALIYLHRYQPDLCSKLLNDYLQAYISKLESSKQNQAQFVLREDISAREKSAAQKEIDKLDSMLKDCRDYEKTLFAVATQKIALDLDDGVKVNYQKFKDVLVPIKGLDKEEA